jgi:hypothetical protein
LAKARSAAVQLESARRSLVQTTHWSYRSSADPGDLAAQSDLIGAPEPMRIEAVLTVPNGGYCVKSKGRRDVALNRLVPGGARCRGDAARAVATD